MTEVEMTIREMIDLAEETATMRRDLEWCRALKDEDLLPGCFDPKNIDPKAIAHAIAEWRHNEN